MELQNVEKYAYLYLGLTRQEFARRLKLGELDPQILQAQLDQNAEEIKLEAVCEQWIESHHLEQVDKYIPTE